MTMRFTVANWHTHTPDYWLAHNGYTIMVSPPKWARDTGRNLSLFAPVNQLPFLLKEGKITEQEYTQQFKTMLMERIHQINRWIQLNDGNHVILLCSCPDGKFCHRHIVASMLKWLDCEQVELESEASV